MQLHSRYQSCTSDTEVERRARCPSESRLSSLGIACPPGLRWIGWTNTRWMRNLNIGLPSRPVIDVQHIYDDPEYADVHTVIRSIGLVRARNAWYTKNQSDHSEGAELNDDVGFDR